MPTRKLPRLILDMTSVRIPAFSCGWTPTMEHRFGRRQSSSRLNPFCTPGSLHIERARPSGPELSDQLGEDVGDEAGVVDVQVDAPSVDQGIEQLLGFLQIEAQ